jgi:hypothetical protein
MEQKPDRGGRRRSQQSAGKSRVRVVQAETVLSNEAIGPT